MMQITHKLFLVFILLTMMNISAQTSDKENEIYEKSCDCIKEVNLGLAREEQYKAVEACIESAIRVKELMSGLALVFKQIEEDKAIDPPKVSTVSEKKEYTVNIDDRKNYRDMEERLLRNCDAMKKVMTTSNNLSDVSVSDKKSAKKAYDKGMELYRAKKLDAAIKQFKKALKKDETFAFAWDMLGASYRFSNDFEKAIEAYNRSLYLDPVGRMPLMNKPIIYALMGNSDKAIEGYLTFIRVFPDDPEGFYGIGRIYHITGDYDHALENTMKAYLMYKSISSPYVQDAERNLALMYTELKEKEKLEIWKTYATKFNIQIGKE